MTDQTEAPAAPEKSEDDGWQFAIVEIFGHRQHAGRTREEERFGAKMLRIDIPKDGDPAKNGWETVYYGGASIFSFTLCTEAAAMKINKPYERPSVMQIAHHDEDEPDYAEDGQFP